MILGCLILSWYFYTVFKSNQTPYLLQRWKKVNFICWLNTTFYVKKAYQKLRPSWMNIIRTLLRRMKWFKIGLSNFGVVVRTQKPYQVQVSISTERVVNILHMHVQSVPQEKVRVFSESFNDFYSFLLCPDCAFKGLRRNHRFVSVLFEVSDITQH